MAGQGSDWPLRNPAALYPGLQPNAGREVALLILLWGLIGATDKPGWAFPASAAALASACLGLQSLMFPDVLSGLEPLWAGAAVAWCIAYGAAAWYRSRRA